MLMDCTSHKQYMAELDAYDRSRKRKERDKMITDETRWMLRNILMAGQYAFNTYKSEYATMKSCKHIQNGDEYLDCMVEKINCVYEKTLPIIRELERVKVYGLPEEYTQDYLRGWHRNYHSPLKDDEELIKMLAN